MEKKIYLLCKSYSKDLNRAVRLLRSIEKHNKDKIPFYMVVPEADRSIFEQKIGEINTHVNWFSDEQIVNANPMADINFYKEYRGYLSQQIIKSEFWRMFDHENYDITYISLDSDCFFIRDFYLSDFLNDSGESFTVMHQNKELLQLANNKKIEKVGRHFHEDCETIQNIFGRVGPHYAYDTPPFILSSRVWKDLDLNYLVPNRMTLWEAIKILPSEMRWYGEALLKYRSIPLIPIEPLFRVYHYDWQYFTNKNLGETEESLQSEYLGIVQHSSWDFRSDYLDGVGKKPWPSRMLRYVKQFLARWR
jgi:Family of unknown function (DUF6492)